MVSSSNKLFEVLEYIFDLVLLNFLFILCSLPVVTAYPAFVALVETIKTLSEEESAPAWKQFFKLFYDYLKKGMKVWVVLLFATIVIAGDIIAVFYLPNALQNLLLPFTVIMPLLLFGIFTNLIKLFILGEHRIKPLFINSFFLLLRHPLKPILVILISAIYLILSVYLRFIPFIIAFSLLAFTCYFLLFTRNSEVNNN
ncbi:DUF624 domain-containing protein [Bacillus sp. D386]|uniref:DUF624 domain-containing protein n=1 Tax=Bacillus sp. D386 TaxID=2587155 RepID=UPI00111DDAB6|nr:DUF624 domain-containing protein [Bacillus sp. D386]